MDRHKGVGRAELGGEVFLDVVALRILGGRDGGVVGEHSHSLL